MKTAEEIFKDYNSNGEPWLHEDDVIGAMEEYADQYKPKWIRLKDETPPFEIITIGYWQNDEFLQDMIFYDGITNQNFTYWHRNLPSPPTL